MTESIASDRKIVFLTSGGISSLENSGKIRRITATLVVAKPIFKALTDK
jgi:hypothetical protein